MAERRNGRSSATSASALIPPSRFGARPGSWAVSLASLAASLVAVGSLRDLLSGSGWWWSAAIATTTALVLAAALRALRLPWPLPTLGALAAGAFVLTAMFGRGSGLLIGIPTPDTVSVVGSLISSASRQAYRESPPATATSGLQLMIAAGLIVLTLAIDLLAVVARKPLVAAVPLLLLAMLPGRALNRPEDLTGLTLTALLILLLLWLDRRRDVAARGAGAVIVASVSVVGALILQSIAPGFAVAPAKAEALQPVFGAGVDPLVRLGDHLRRGADTLALSYETTSTKPVYLRLVTLSDFEGDSWSPATPGYQRGNQLDDIDDPPGLGSDVTTARIETRIRDASAARRWLPLPYPAESVSGLASDSWRFESADLSASSGSRPASSSSYTVVSNDVLPTAEQLAAGGGASAQLSLYLTTPDALPAIISSTAEEVTAGAATGYDRAVALQEFFRSSSFAYDENTPVEEGFDGDSMDVLATFLDVRRGYCVHYASAMAVMARTIDIPARVAVGYQPGEQSTTGEDAGHYEVTTWDLHAWPELYFEGVGWVRFEPTPSRGAVPAYSTATTDDDIEEAQENTPTPLPTATSAAERPRDDASTTAAGGSSADLNGLASAALVLALLFFLLAPAIARAARRERRIVAASRRGARMEGAWDEVADTAFDLGIVHSPTLSPRQLLAALHPAVRLLPEDSRSLEILVGIVERERFASATSAAGQEQDVAASLSALLDRVLTALRNAAERRSRIRAALLPPSLFAKLTPSRLAFRWSPPGSD